MLNRGLKGPAARAGKGEKWNRSDPRRAAPARPGPAQSDPSGCFMVAVRHAVLPLNSATTFPVNEARERKPRAPSHFRRQSEKITGCL